MRLFWCFLIAICFFSVPSKGQDIHKRSLQNAVAAIQDSSYSNAISMLSAVIKKDSMALDAFRLRGLAYLEKGDSLLALKDYDYVLAEDQEDTIMYSLRAELNFDLEKYTESILDYSKALQLDPIDPDLYRGRGMVYYFLDEFSLALEDFQSAILIESDQASDFFYAGVCQAELGNSFTAYTYFNTSLALDDQAAQAYYHRGVALYEMEFGDKACEDWAIARDLGMVELAEFIKKFCSEQNLKQNNTQ
ncbi:tetratricopeptide repeat protein [Aureibacter tunicatorum]|uniref:Tetratricopeptide (TPR) repeat protein n=1 Tax=Aureibacter tunicatorum TaxID=866807 RepID=A0AAE3XMF3_9BACT|nr:tetratricopeptide repeat protein [Aureibacter tunicatorum]MDR6239137.1 tetratricopeptide (TPR) repeat protein [Aureibacter tunicatorum]BDD04937.1 hypothetical protein AUTU_24200 [Aureibacter tunicatorum]